MKPAASHAGLPPRRWYRTAFLTALAILTGGCGWDESTPDRTTERIITPGQAPTVLAPAAAVTATASNRLREGDSVMQRVDPDSLTAVIPVAPMAAPPLLTRKNFIDSPLPDELRNDGDLTPLPPPAQSTDR